MSKKQFLSVLIFSILLSLLVNVFFGRLITAKISTLPILNRMKLLSPQAPIVINTREEIRVSDSEDAQKTINTVRSKLSLVVAAGQKGATVLGGAVNLTSDGLFLVSKTAIEGQQAENLRIKLDDGTLIPIVSVYPDPATGLAILKANANNIQTANFADSRNIAAGSRILFLSLNKLNHSLNFQNSFITQSQATDSDAVRHSDFPRFSFGAQATGALMEGEALVNMNGEIAGIWTAEGIIPSDILRNFSSGYLASSGKPFRPHYGFQYKNTDPVEEKLSGLPSGARVAEVAAGSPAEKAGLREGDVIVSVGGSQLGSGIILGQALLNFKAGEAVKLAVSRGGQNLELVLTPTQLK